VNAGDPRAMRRGAAPPRWSPGVLRTVGNESATNRRDASAYGDARGGGV
jgi:hypothetical protein